MNSYVELQMALVSARQSALRAEADTTRLLATASPLPAVSAGSRAAAPHAATEQTGAPSPARSLGAAAAIAAPAVPAAPKAIEPVSACDCSHGVVAAA